MGELYKLDFELSGKSYIGITINSARDRFGKHRWAFMHNKQSALYHAWRKYGEPTFKILAIVENKLLHETEIKAIATYKTLAPYGYNVTRGGEGTLGWVPTEEWRRKRITALTGRSLSLETRAKISTAHLGKSLSREHRAKIGRASQGRIPSAETRAKISSAGMGNRRALGNKLTEVTRARMSTARKGVPKSLEHRAKISAAMRKFVQEKSNVTT